MLKWLGGIGGWQGYAAAAALCFLAGSVGTWRVMSWREQAHENQATIKIVQHTVKASDITFKVGMTFETVRLHITEETQRRLADVDIHLSPKTDSDFAVPCGFVRVFNDANHGPIPEPAVCPDAAASDIAFSTVGKTEIINAGQYDTVAARLLALQDWIKQQQALHQ